MYHNIFSYFHIQITQQKFQIYKNFLIISKYLKDFEKTIFSCKKFYLFTAIKVIYILEKITFKKKMLIFFFRKSKNFYNKNKFYIKQFHQTLNL